MEIRKRKNESVGTFLYRFSKRVQQSGVLKEVKKRRFSSRPQNKIKRRSSAIYKAKKAKEVKKMRKLGYNSK
ncbi:30S ribosomal protein S21 [Patescibacteria group bacterium]|nr:30S ribosomal protein S21 [Patescibacteria group bacterium]